MTEGNIGAFNYREYLQTQRIHWLVQGKGYAASVLRAPSGLSLATVLSYLDDARAYTAAIITELYPGEQAGFMQGIILGTIDELDPEIYTDFSTLGLTHLLAISGLHVGVFMLFAGTVLHLLRISRERSALILLCLVPLYIIFTGAAPSAVRSGIMAMFGLWAARHQLFKDGLHLLALAATLMLISDPFYLEQVGFQLSFVVTAGLLLGVPLVRHLLPNVRRNPWRGIFDLLAVSLVAQLASLPIILYYFHQVHLLSLAVNLLLVPFVSFIILPLGMLSVLVALVMHTTLISSLIIFGNTQVFRLVALLSDVTALRLIWREPPLWWVFAVYAAFGGLLVLMKQRLAEQALLRLLPMQRAAQMRRLAFGVRGSGLALLILLVGAYIQLPPKASVLSFLNVGQGDAALVTTLSGAQILIDGGGSLPLPREPWRVRARPYDVGRQTVVPLLQQRGVRELDLVVLSHLDSDHIEGMRAVLANVPVRGVLWNGTYKDNALVEELFTDILARGIPLYRADEGDVLTFAPGVQLYVLGTGTEDGGNVAAIDYAYEQNSRSVGFILSLYGRNFLFTGDADDQEEAALMAHADHLFGKDRADRPTIDVMKVSHHGSRTSTSLAWLAYWQPQTAVISVGRNNLYNHPTPQVLTRLQIAQALVYRTDRDGEVQFRVAPDGTMDVRTTTQ
jgi:competence protein ComEC